MSAIRDDVRLSELALAGTHDSATFDTSLFPVVDDIVRTQTLSFDEQLKYGIRVLDLRIRRTSEVTLGQARGKFVVLSNIFELNSLGLSYSSFGIQDDSTLKTNWDLHEKYLKVRRHLHRFNGP
ncbi:hypothetical protein [Pseudomonas xanthosomatis]|uniref:hypothetical protein n=1 Tax=Pseudomonas xanthosomatis TaxID=2842356 RepID=UPI0035190108